MTLIVEFKKRGRKGQLKISFGMIFSILLIIAFLAVAIYAIIQFLSILNCAETGMYKEDLQHEIDRAWKSEETYTEFDKGVPSSLSHICFIDLNSEKSGEYSNYYENISIRYNDKNMFFWPLEEVCSGQGAFQIKHVNISEITKNNNPYCIEVREGRASIKIEKGIYDALVKIK